MAVFYLLHEYTERYHPNYPLGKKFARTAILGFIIYYTLFFILPLWLPERRARIQHFIKYLVVVDVMASSIFYGGFFNSIFFWSIGRKAMNVQEEINYENLRNKNVSLENFDPDDISDD